MKWLNDEDFIRAEVPMTKKAIRVLSVSYLGLEEGLSLLNIGSGTGSISVQVALLGAHITAIERKEEGVHLLRENAKRHGAEVKAIHGLALEDLPDQDSDRASTGRSAGNLEEIFSYLDKHSKKSGVLVGNYITLEDTWKMRELPERHNYQDINVELVQTAKLDHLRLMKGENPVYIMKGARE